MQLSPLSLGGTGVGKAAATGSSSSFYFSGAPAQEKSKQKGDPPSPWSISVTNKRPFHVEDVIVRVPNTTEIHRCRKCPGTAKIQCVLCQGKGFVACETCRIIRCIIRNTFTIDDWTVCGHCEGSSFRPCSICSSSGKVWCNECDGKAYVESNIELQVSFRVASSRYSSYEVIIPPHILGSAKGHLIEKDVRQKALPIPESMDATIHQISKEMIDDHQGLLEKNRILYQSQLLESVPVCRILVKHKRTVMQLIAYGTDRQIFNLDKPGKLICV